LARAPGKEGIEGIRKAMSLNPYHPERYRSHLGRAYFSARCYAEAVEAFSRVTRPDYNHHSFLATSLAQMGNKIAAEAHAREVSLGASFLDWNAT
jgi:adenylate cyclase